MVAAESMPLESPCRPAGRSAGRVSYTRASAARGRTKTSSGAPGAGP